MEHELDAAIASFMEQPEPEVQSTPEKVEEPQADEPDQPEGDQETDAEDNAPFPKKAVNALSRRDKIIAKERATVAALKAELDQLRSASLASPKNEPQVSNDAPKEEDYDNYGDFLEAKLLHKVKLEQANQAKELEARNQAEQRNAWVAEREQGMVVKAQEHAQSIPDFVNVLEDVGDFLDTLPPEITQAFYEADDAAMAVYNLAKEGKLEAIARMSPYKAAMEIAKAEAKKVQVNRVSNAPQPIKSATGRGVSSKGFDDMNGVEMMKTLGIKY